MDQLFHNSLFVDFGPQNLHPFATANIQRVQGRKVGGLRSRVRQLAPRKPGVYGMLNVRDEVIYIGKAKCLRTRLLGYFRPKSRAPKAGRIIRNSTGIVWEIAANEFAALHRELELIRRWRPRFNVQGQPNARRPIYVCLGRMPAPYLFLAKRPPKDAMAFYGPITHGRRAKEAVRRLNDWFQLRDCSQAQTMNFADQGELFPLELSPGCLRHEIGTCLGPCAAACDREDYFSATRSAQAFLNGDDLTILKAAQQEMERASEKQIFEQAASHRDRLLVLAWLHEQLQQMRQLQANSSFIYPLTGHDGTTFWYFIHSGQTICALPAPHDEPTRKHALEQIRTVFQRPFHGTREQSLARRDSILLVAGWFHRYPEERTKTLSVDKAMADLLGTQKK